MSKKSDLTKRKKEIWCNIEDNSIFCCIFAGEIAIL